MSGVEILGAVASGSQVIGHCLSALQHIQNLLAEYRNGTDDLSLISQDVGIVISLVRLIDGEPVLHLQEVLDGVEILKARALSLKKFIEHLVPKFKKNSARQKISFIKYLTINASQDLNQLGEKRRHLLQANVGLLSLLSVAKIGLHCDNSCGQIIVNVIAIQRVDNLLRGYQGLKNGILMARFLQECGLSEKAEEVPLCEAHLNTLECMLADAQAANAEGTEEMREVVDNRTIGHALMMNGKLGDGTKSRNAFIRSRNVSIRGNVAEGCSLMVNDNLSINGYEAVKEDWVMHAAVSQGAKIPVTENLFRVKRTNMSDY